MYVSVEVERFVAPLLLAALALALIRLPALRVALGVLLLAVGLILATIASYEWAQLDAFTQRVELGQEASEPESLVRYHAKQRALYASAPLSLAGFSMGLGLLLLSWAGRGYAARSAAREPAVAGNINSRGEGSRAG